MSVQFDIATGKAVIEGREVDIDSDEAFAALVQLWTVVGWRKKYSYRFSWMGRPVIQLPEDMLRIQELIWRIKPDLLIETGIAHGGSLIFYASLFEAMGKGRVLGIDIDIRPHNRAAIEAHPMMKRIAMIQGSSIAPDIAAQARGHIRPGETVLVILDSNHSKAHVLAELQAYAPMVSKDSYIVVTDGIMEDLAADPRAPAGWDEDNPKAAARDYLRQNGDFVLDRPTPPFNESNAKIEPTHWPDAYLKRIK